MSGKVVILRALGLGDLLTAVPALRALARAFPDKRLLLAAPRELEPLVQLVGGVDGVVHTRRLEPLPAAVHGADVAVNLHGRGPRSHRLLLAARPRRLIAFRHDEVPASAGSPEWRSGEHEVARWCRLLEESGIPADPEDVRLEAPTGPALPRWARGATLIHPGAASGARRWPAERFAAVALAERKRGQRVIVTGTPDEAELARRVAALAELPPASVVAGRTGLLELAALVAAARRVVCGDTGVGHLATALGTPSVVLFGPVPPSEWGPAADRPLHRALWAGHRGDPHAEEPDPGLLELDPTQVLLELERLPVLR